MGMTRRYLAEGAGALGTAVSLPPSHGHSGVPTGQGDEGTGLSPTALHEALLETLYLLERVWMTTEVLLVVAYRAQFGGVGRLTMAEQSAPEVVGPAPDPAGRLPVRHLLEEELAAAERVRVHWRDLQEQLERQLPGWGTLRTSPLPAE